MQKEEVGAQGIMYLFQACQVRLHSRLPNLPYSDYSRGTPHGSNEAIIPFPFLRLDHSTLY